MAVTKDDVFSFIDNMTILEMSQFIKEFEERYGVTAAAPVAVAAATGAAAGAPAAAEHVGPRRSAKKSNQAMGAPPFLLD